MPVVRNGRGEKAVYEVGLSGEPPGPIERRQATAAEREAWAAEPPPGPLARTKFSATAAEIRAAALRGGEANRQRSAAQRAAFGVGHDPRPPTPLINVADPPVIEPEEEPVMSAPEPTLPVLPGLELVTPCGDCLHEPVCAIRSSLDPEAFRVATVEEFSPALSLRPRIDVDCGHFLPGPTRLEVTGGVPGRAPYVQRMLDALVQANGDFTIAARALGIKRSSLVGSMSALRRRTDLTEAEQAVVARRRGGSR